MKKGEKIRVEYCRSIVIANFVVHRKVRARYVKAQYDDNYHLEFLNIVKIIRELFPRIKTGDWVMITYDGAEYRYKYEYDATREGGWDGLHLQGVY